MPVYMQNDPTKEFQAPTLLPKDIDVYGVIEKCDTKPLTFKKGANAGRTATVFDVTFRVLGGEYAGSRVFDSLFMNVEIYEDMGQYTSHQFGDCRKFFALLRAIGAIHVPEGMDTPVYTLPCNKVELEQLLGGTGPYAKGLPVIGTLLGIKTGHRDKPKWENGGPVKGPDGKDVLDTVTTIADIFFPSENMLSELDEALHNWQDSRGNSQPAAKPVEDDDIPF